MSRQVILEFFGFTGTGKTTAEAKQNAGLKILALKQGSWEPVIVSWRGESVLIYRTLEGYVSRFLQHDGAPLRVSTGSTYYGEDLKETIRSVQNHIVQLGWTFDDPIDTFPEWYTDRNDRGAAISYRQWQINYRELIRRGFSDNEAHGLAAGHPDTWPVRD